MILSNGITTQKIYSFKFSSGSSHGNFLKGFQNNQALAILRSYNNGMVDREPDTVSHITSKANDPYEFFSDIIMNPKSAAIFKNFGLMMV